MANRNCFFKLQNKNCVLCQKSSDKMRNRRQIKSNLKFKRAKKLKVKLFLPKYAIIMDVIKVPRDVTVKFRLN